MRYSVSAILLMVVFSAFAGEMTVTIPLDVSIISFEEAGIYTRITGTGMGLTGTEGEPSLPEFTAMIALPTGCAATNIEIVDAVYTEVRGRFTVMPAAAPVPFSVEREVHPVEPDHEIYSSTSSYPGQPVKFAGSSVIMGIPVAYARVFPVKWNPAGKTIEILTTLTLNVTYETSPEASTVSRRSIQSELRSREIVRNSVVNPEAVSGSGATIVDSRALTYGEYVIIAPPDYVSCAQELADWKTSKGIPTNVYTTTWIQGQYTCYDLQQEIRAFLTDCRNEGVEYVLIYGDDDRIAGRNVIISAGGSTEYPPVDLYWADINDTAPGADRWDSNHNHIWGEYNIDDVDYHSDLWVGRASVNTTSECTIFNSKVFAYERIGVTDYFDTAPIEMRIGYTTELLWPDCYGSAGAEIISAYIPSSAWEQEKCYDSSGNNSVSITQNMINDGPHHLYHASHGSQTSFSLPGGSYTTTDFMDQTNISGGGLPAIWNSISCLIGYLDYSSDCLGDAWNNSPNGGGFGAFNARYGWGIPSDPGNGPSEILCQYFYDVMWNDNQYNLGVAHLMGSDKMSPPSDEYDDWCIKEYNLFGDPELPMWSTDATNLLVSYPGSIGGTGNVTLTVTSGGSPVSGARVCLQKGDWQTGEVYEVGTTNSSGSVTLYVKPVTTGSMAVVAWARNHIVFNDGTINVIGSGFEDDGTRNYVNGIDTVYPSPAVSAAIIPFSLASAGTARIDVYDVSGRIVTTLAAGEMEAGQHSLMWELDNAYGEAVPAGVYHVRVSSTDWSGITSLVVVR